MCSVQRQYQEHKIRITRTLSSWILIQHQAPTRSYSDTYYTQLSQNFVWLSKTTTLTLKSFIVGLCNYWSGPPKCMSFLDYKMSSFFLFALLLRVVLWARLACSFCYWLIPDILSGISCLGTQNHNHFPLDFGVNKYLCHSLSMEQFKILNAVASLSEPCEICVGITAPKVSSRCFRL